MSHYIVPFYRLAKNVSSSFFEKLKLLISSTQVIFLVSLGNNKIKFLNICLMS